MFVVTMLLRRRPDLSADAFHQYWRDHHGPLAVSLAQDLGIRGYVQLHAVPSAIGDALAGSRGCAPCEWDGIAVLSFDSEEACVAAATTPEGRAGALALLEDERNFLDHPRCEFVIAEGSTFIS
jgi:uncharacterized protein (TIGR02118 family)